MSDESQNNPVIEIRNAQDVERFPIVLLERPTNCWRWRWVDGWESIQDAMADQRFHMAANPDVENTAVARVLPNGREAVLI